MRVNNAGLIKTMALVLVAGAALMAPIGAKAEGILNGLSIRGGLYIPQNSGIRSLTDFGVWGGGIDYKLPFVPKAFNGDNWSTSLSVDFHYSERKSGIFRSLPVSINQVYTFDEENGRSPFAGFCVTANTFGSTIPSGGSKTLTRFGAGLIVGMNMTKSFYVEGRYEWIDSHHVPASPSGFRGYVGYRF